MSRPGATAASYGPPANSNSISNSNTYASGSDPGTLEATGTLYDPNLSSLNLLSPPASHSLASHQQQHPQQQYQQQYQHQHQHQYQQQYQPHQHYSLTPSFTPAPTFPPNSSPAGSAHSAPSPHSSSAYSLHSSAASAPSAAHPSPSSLAANGPPSSLYSSSSRPASTTTSSTAASTPSRMYTAPGSGPQSLAGKPRAGAPMPPHAATAQPHSQPHSQPPHAPQQPPSQAYGTLTPPSTVPGSSASGSPALYSSPSSSSNSKLAQLLNDHVVKEAALISEIERFKVMVDEERLEKQSFERRTRELAESKDRRIRDLESQLAALKPSDPSASADKNVLVKQLEDELHRVVELLEREREQGEKQRSESNAEWQKRVTTLEAEVSNALQATERAHSDRLSVEAYLTKKQSEWEAARADFAQQLQQEKLKTSQASAAARDAQTRVAVLENDLQRSEETLALTSHERDTLIQRLSSCESALSQCQTTLQTLEAERTQQFQRLYERLRSQFDDALRLVGEFSRTSTVLASSAQPLGNDQSTRSAAAPTPRDGMGGDGASASNLNGNSSSSSSSSSRNASANVSAHLSSDLWSPARSSQAASAQQHSATIVRVSPQYRSVVAGQQQQQRQQQQHHHADRDQRARRFDGNEHANLSEVFSDVESASENTTSESNVASRGGGDASFQPSFIQTGRFMPHSDATPSGYNNITFGSSFDRDTSEVHEGDVVYEDSDVGNDDANTTLQHSRDGADEQPLAADQVSPAESALLASAPNLQAELQSLRALRESILREATTLLGVDGAQKASPPKNAPQALSAAAANISPGSQKVATAVSAEPVRVSYEPKSSQLFPSSSSSQQTLGVASPRSAAPVSGEPKTTGLGASSGDAGSAARRTNGVFSPAAAKPGPKGTATPSSNAVGGAGGSVRKVTFTSK